METLIEQKEEEKKQENAKKNLIAKIKISAKEAAEALYIISKL